MKTVLLLIVFVLFTAFVCEYHGFKRGFAAGSRVTSAWWIDQDSQSEDTSQMFPQDSGNTRI
jgi:hypothetical protein